MYSYFSAAASFASPELSDARMSWAKNSALIGIIDDLYDVRGSVEEKENLIQLVELYVINHPYTCSSTSMCIYIIVTNCLQIMKMGRGC